MAFSYSGSPGTDPLDTLRFLTGDTTEGVALLGDGEIRYLLTQHTTPEAALLPALRMMLLQCVHDTIESADGITRNLTERRLAIEALLTQVQYTTAIVGPPFLGGVSVAERDRRDMETDLIQPAFGVSRNPDREGLY